MRSFPDASTLFYHAVRLVRTEGEEVVTRGLTSKEVIGLSLRLTDPSRCVVTLSGRNASESFMAAEWLWIASGRDDVSFISQFSSKISRYSDDGVRFYGAYGPRWLSQLPELLDRFKADLYTRQGVMTFWHQSPQASKDIPCTVGLHFIYRDGQLNLISWMRSNDLWLGLPYDTFTFCQLLNLVAAELGVKIGWYQLNVDSLHLYQEHWTRAKRLTPLEQRVVVIPTIDLNQRPLMTVLKTLNRQLDDLSSPDPKLLQIDGLGQFITRLSQVTQK